MTEAIVKSQEIPGTGLAGSAAAKQCLRQVDDLAAQLAAAEGNLEHGYARLGCLLVRVHKLEFWREAEYPSFGQYIRSVGEKYNRKRTQLYHYFSTVRELSPYISEENLDSMGIAKAAELKRSVKRTGRLPAAEIVGLACDPTTTVQEVKRLLFEGETPPPAGPEGTWLDQEGFYVTADERKVIEAADEAALRTDPVVQPDVPAWVRRKEARLRQAMEFLAAHSGSEKM